MNKYIPQEFEKKWIDYWEKEQTYQTAQATDKKPKTYSLVMFPYPSGEGLHVGHARVYTGTDVLARYFRMKGDAVLHPMGWDAFGLPAENAAIKAKKNPMDLVPKNIANFKRQMKMLGLSYDWNRELATTDPSYYRITQWLFTLFFKLGLLYKKETHVYFCPVCKTGLAEEEVTAEGTHERCGNKITRKSLPQWIFKITDYADSLLAGLKDLEWPSGILEMQKNWIGRKEGINITYDVVINKDSIDKITVFTTRPDTNFGATFIVLAPEHELVTKILNPKSEIRKKYKISSSKLEEIKQYVRKTMAKTDLERITEGRKKTGVFTGFYAVNNLNKKLMPIWVSDFVLSEFGTGAVVGVPGHDMRDFEFAQEFGLDIIRVVIGKDGDKSVITRKEQVQEDEGIMINSGFLNGIDIHTATQKIMDYMEKKGFGKKIVTYHLRDWIFSRQRYWGEPIPMVYCQRCADSKISWWSQQKDQGSKVKGQDGDEKNKKEYLNNIKLDQKITDKVEERIKNVKDKMHGWFPISENQLPLKLPYLQYYEPTGTGESPLAKVEDWVETKCPNCGSLAKRETDTMPNWAGSCWYFLAFAFWKNAEKAKNTISFKSSLISPFIQQNIQKWLAVDWYIGGAEHAVLHLLYSRFWMHILNDVGLISFREPFRRLRNVGMVLAEDHHKMSKSLGNVINPDHVVAEYGADALRLYEMFMAPFNQEIAWSTQTLQGTYRFLNRIWQIYHNSAYITKIENEEDKRLVIELQRTINKVTIDITNVKYNTAIAHMMKLLNLWEGQNKNVGVDCNSNSPLHKQLSKSHAKQFLQILSPFAPFITEEIWQTVLQEKDSIHLSHWPTIETVNVSDEEIKIPVQVDGKVRGIMSVLLKDATENNLIKIALANPKIFKWLDEKKYKVIYIKNKILNFVLE